MEDQVKATASVSGATLAESAPAWGGAGFAGYEVKMEHEDRVEAATALWNQDQGEETPDADGEDGGGEEGVEGAAEPKPGEAVAAKPGEAAGAKPGVDATKAADEKLPFAAHPRFQELRQKEEQLAALDALRDDGLKNADGSARLCTPDELKLQLDDARAMYRILNGQASPDILLDLVKKDYPKVYEAIGARFAGGQPAGAAKPNGAAAGASTGAAPNGAASAAAFEDPLAKKVEELEGWRKEQLTQAQQRELGERRNRTVQAFSGQVARLAKEAGIEDQAEIEEYGEVLSARIGADPAARERLEKGNLVDVRRLFAERRNRTVERAKASSEARIAGKTNLRAGAPRTPAGGSPVGPEVVRRGSLADRDTRLAAAAEAWKG